GVPSRAPGGLRGSGVGPPRGSHTIRKKGFRRRPVPPPPPRRSLLAFGDRDRFASERSCLVGVTEVPGRPCVVREHHEPRLEGRRVADLIVLEYEDAACVLAGPCEVACVETVDRLRHVRQVSPGTRT